MVVNCPKCGKKTALLNDTCEHCGIKVKHCPECENIMQESENTCDYCGYSFEEVKTVENNKNENNQNANKQEEIPKELKTTATKLMAFAEQENKKYKKISKILDAISWVLIVVAVAVPQLLLTSQTSLYGIYTARTIFHVVMIIELIISTTGNVIGDFRVLLSQGAIIRQVRALRFDYKKYYSYKNAGNHIFDVTKDFDYDGEVRLIQAIRYYEDASNKKLKILRAVGFAILELVCSILIYVGLTMIMDGSFRAIIVGIAWSFAINAPIIIGSALYIICAIIEGVLNNDDKEAKEWIIKIRRESADK